MERVRLDELILDDRWEDENRGDLEFEKQRDTISKDARKRCKENPNKEPCTMPQPEIGLPVPTTEDYPTLKLAKKKLKFKRSKKTLDGVYEVPAPASSVIKSNDYTSIIKEPGKRQVSIGNSDLATLSTKADNKLNRFMLENVQKMQWGRLQKILKLDTQKMQN